MRIFLIVLYLKQNVHEQVRSGDVKLGSLKIKPALLHLLSMCVMEIYCIHKTNTDLYYTNIIPKEISNKFFVSPCIINVAFALICILPHFHRKRFLSRLTTVRSPARKPLFNKNKNKNNLFYVVVLNNDNISFTGYYTTVQRPRQIPRTGNGPDFFFKLKCDHR